METAWFRLVIQNDSLQHRTLILDLDQALLSRIEWRASSASSLKEILTGQSYPHASRDVDYDFCIQAGYPGWRNIDSQFFYPHPMLRYLYPN